jgi:hypothetical protein
MKKPLALVFTAVMALSSLPAGVWAEDPPNQSQTLEKLKQVDQDGSDANGWHYDAQTKSLVKAGYKPIPVEKYRAADKTGAPPATAGKSHFRSDLKGSVPPGHEIDPKKEPSTLSKIGHSQLTWIAGGGILGAIAGAAVAGPLGFLLVGAIGLVCGAVAHHIIIGSGDAKPAPKKK